MDTSRRSERLPLEGKPFLKVGKALLLGKHTPPVTLCSVTDSSGMTATGSHEYFYSLRGAQPPGEGFFRPFGADLFPFLSSLKMGLFKKSLSKVASA